jgi:hypothetical protein
MADLAFGVLLNGDRECKGEMVAHSLVATPKGLKGHQNAYSDVVTVVPVWTKFKYLRHWVLGFFEHTFVYG